MFKKLVKYEWKETKNVFLCFVCVVLIVTIFAFVVLQISAGDITQNQVMKFQDDNIQIGELMTIIGPILYSIVLMGLTFVFQVYTVIRFYRTTLCDTGYLTFTLPVKAGKIILSKCLVFTIWSIIFEIIAEIFSILICCFPNVKEEYEAMVQELSQMDHVGLYIAMYILIVILATISRILAFYASIAIGHLFGKYKIVFAVAAYLLYLILNAIVFFISFILGFISGLNGTEEVVHQIPKEVWMMLCIELGVCFVISIVAYIITNYIFTKKINIE